MTNNLYEQRIKIISGFLIAAFVGLFNETALNMAIAQLIVDFDSDASTIQWLTTGYLLTLGVLVPISSILMQRFTTRQLFIASLLFSISGTLISAIAPSFIILLIGRVIQAAGTAIILPLMIQVVLLVYPIYKRGAAMGNIGLVIIFAPAISPTVAGFVLSQLTWHYIFWFSLPFLIFAFLIGLKYVQNVSEVKAVKFDVVSIILSTIGFGGIVYGFSISGKLGSFLATEVLIAIGIGLLALLLFGLRQFKLEQPMLNLRVFTYRMYSIGVSLIVICMIMILSTMILLPIYLQNILLLAPIIAGLVLLPGGVINAFMSVAAGNLFDRFGPRVMVPAGLMMAMIGLFALRTIDGSTSVYFVAAFHITMFIGITLTMMPAQTNGLNELPKKLYPDGTALLNTLQQVAGAVGTAIAITIMSISTTNYVNAHGDTVANQMEGSIQGVQNSITFGLTVAVIGFVLSLFLRRVQ